VTEGQFANEYGGHQASVTAGEFGWNFAGPAIFSKGAGLLTSGIGRIGLPSLEGMSIGAPSFGSLSAASINDPIFSIGAPKLFISEEFAAEQAKAAALHDIRDFYSNEAEPSFTRDPAIPERYLDPTNRPGYANGQVEQVWNAAKNGAGKVYDPFTGEELTWDMSRPRTDQWQMGHLVDNEYRTVHAKLIAGDMTWEEFFAWYKDPMNYQPQSIPSNTSGRFEAR
jgi:hypothetical protein